MPSYDAVHFDPPAPAAVVKLRNPNNGTVISDVPLLLDTGADVTLLPQTAVHRLGIAPVADQQYELMGFDGSKILAPAVVLDLIFLRRAIRGRYMLIEEEWGVLGRDVLNLVTLLFDGPRTEWSERAP
jgi:hypothetical protein